MGLYYIVLASLNLEYGPYNEATRGGQPSMAAAYLYDNFVPDTRTLLLHSVILMMEDLQAVGVLKLAGESDAQTELWSSSRIARGILLLAVGFFV